MCLGESKCKSGVNNNLQAPGNPHSGNKYY